MKFYQRFGVSAISISCILLLLKLSADLDEIILKDMENKIMLSNLITDHIMLKDMKSAYNRKSSLKNKCPLIPVGLVGPIKVKTNVTNADMESLSYLNITSGGSWKPASCTPYQKIAILVPFRNREQQINIFLYNIHKFVQNQMIEYRIYIINQTHHGEWNKGLLFNVGFKTAISADDYDCFILQDVDLLPEDDRNMYICSSMPRHMAVVKKFDYTLPFKDSFGGVVSINKEDMIKVNGFTNRFTNWGGEDDDFFNRILRSNLATIRYPLYISKYLDLPHEQSKLNISGWNRVQDWEKYTNDGLTDLKYTSKKIDKLPLYTRILVHW